MRHGVLTLVLVAASVTGASAAGLSVREQALARSVDAHRDASVALLDVLREDQARSGRRAFIEYVLWAGVNDTAEDAARLAALLDGMDAQVNVIPHNGFAASGPGLPMAGRGPDPRPAGLRAPSDDAVRAFQAALVAAGVRGIVRWPRGRDIAAACGQLAGRIQPLSAEA